MWKQLLQAIRGNPQPQRIISPLADTTPTPTPTPDPRSSWDNFVDLVMREGNKRGYHGETLARQKALESGYGESEFAKRRYNYGGVGAYDQDPNQAFSFKSPEDYLSYYFKMIEKRFPKAYAVRSDGKRYIEELKKGNYASDPDYLWKVMNTRVYKNRK